VLPFQFRATSPKVREIARRIGLGNSQLINDAEGLSHEIGKMIYTILQKLRT